jgi:hypothetical protein
MLSGMTATSIGPDSNQVLQALGKLKWLCVMDAVPDHQLGVLAAPGIDPARCRPRCSCCRHALDREGRVVHQQRPVGAVEGGGAAARGRVPHDHWILAELFSRVRELYQQQGGKFPDPVAAADHGVQDPRRPELDEIAQEINGKDLTTGKRLESFALLKDDGTTTAGDWIYTGHYPESGNRTKGRAGIRTRPTTIRPGWASTRAGRGAGR